MKMIAVLIPLLLGLLAFTGRRPAALAAALAPLAALPAIWLGLVPGDPQHFAGILLGTSLAVDPVSQPVLLLSGLVWALAAWFGLSHIRTRRSIYHGFWLLTLTGVYLVCLAADMITFYLGYATLSLAAYGLIIHVRNSEALRAGRVYLAMMLISEALVLAGLLQMAAVVGNAPLAGLGELLAGTELHASVFWLFLAGFGIKLGVMPLHFWAPLADPAAPVPARAILSGTLAKAGLLGWLRFLPPEVVPAGVDPMILLIALGLAGAFAGALLGLTQVRPKVILAYSTISQMGLMLVAFALTLAGPEARATVLPILGLFVLHHGLNKAALFLGTGCSPGAGRLRFLLMALPGLSLAGLPLMTGDLVKTLLKPALPGWAGDLVTWTSVTTALLVFHLLYRAWKEAEESSTRAPLHPAWPALVILGSLVPWLWLGTLEMEMTRDFAGFWAALWPALLAFGLWAVWRNYLRGAVPAVPAGDLGVLVERLAGHMQLAWLHLAIPRPKADIIEPRRRIAPVINFSESWLRTLPALGAALLVLSVVLWFLLLGGG